MMLSAIKFIAKRMRRDLDLPAGHTVEVDHKTGNIIVKNDCLGFVVCREYLREHDLDFALAEVAEQLAHLKAATAPVTTTLGRISTVEQIAAAANGETTFDKLADE
jgi:hypothetical protein